MAQFVLIAYDSKEDGAFDRRVRIREAHLESNKQLRAEGKLLCGAAITDENGKMVGSIVIMNFPSREEFDAWLKHEPYMIGKVWEEVTVLNADLSPVFNDLIQER